MFCAGFVLPAEKMGVKGENIIDTEHKNKDERIKESDKGKNGQYFDFDLDISWNWIKCFKISGTQVWIDYSVQEYNSWRNYVVGGILYHQYQSSTGLVEKSIIAMATEVEVR